MQDPLRREAGSSAVATAAVGCVAGAKLSGRHHSIYSQLFANQKPPPTRAPRQPVPCRPQRAYAIGSGTTPSAAGPCRPQQDLAAALGHAPPGHPPYAYTQRWAQGTAAPSYPSADGWSFSHVTAARHMRLADTSVRSQTARHSAPAATQQWCGWWLAMGGPSAHGHCASTRLSQSSTARGRESTAR